MQGRVPAPELRRGHRDLMPCCRTLPCSPPIRAPAPTPACKSLGSGASFAARAARFTNRTNVHFGKTFFKSRLNFFFSHPRPKGIGSSSRRSGIWVTSSFAIFRGTPCLFRNSYVDSLSCHRNSFANPAKSANSFQRRDASCLKVVPVPAPYSSFGSGSAACPHGPDHFLTGLFPQWREMRLQRPSFCTTCGNDVLVCIALKCVAIGIDPPGHRLLVFEPVTARIAGTSPTPSFSTKNL